ncbi:MAG: DegT/DnrJ/EryC1/StrS family aminotransferase, partial [Lachnospiraceae bacterium]|nr:DegT/DnrJ/EryC1/StrS family aminotransferase [Lachnospiraceae bacterium]
PHYQHTQYGYNYRMSNVVAGIGRGQLLHLDEHVSLKRAIYEQYKEAFADIEKIEMNPMNPDGEANCWLSCLTLSKDCKINPLAIIDALAAENIESRPIWKPMHLQPVYADCDFFTKDGLCTVAKDCNVGVGDIVNPDSVGADIFNRGMCLPSDIKNTAEDMEKIIGIVRSFFK